MSALHDLVAFCYQLVVVQDLSLESVLKFFYILKSLGSPV